MWIHTSFMAKKPKELRNVPESERGTAGYTTRSLDLWMDKDGHRQTIRMWKVRLTWFK